VAPGACGLKGAVDALNAFLLRAHAEGRSSVLVIDEAQSLAPEVLEQLRLLTNLETAERKLLQIILIGQPELREMLARPDLEQLAQRVIARYHLGPLSREETTAYIRHRLSVAGAQAQMPFEPAALACIHRLTGGVPRRINLLADRALLGAYAHQRARVDRRTVERAAREVFGAPAQARQRSAAPASRTAMALGAVLLVLLAVGMWTLGPWQQRLAGPGASVALAELPASTVDMAVAALASASAVSVAAAAEPASAVATEDAPAAVAAASDDPAELLASALADEGIAWRELALRWNVAIGEGDACIAAAQASLVCLRPVGGGLGALRQLDRPGILALRHGDGRPVWALLVGLTDSAVSLQVGAQRFVLTLPALARVWRGEFATFWRAPQGWRDGADAIAQPAVRGWVSEQLDAAGIDAAAPMRERVRVFQLAQGLPPDGLAGPMTMIRLNRVAGIDEPVIEGGR